MNENISGNEYHENNGFSDIPEDTPDSFERIPVSPDEYIENDLRNDPDADDLAAEPAETGNLTEADGSQRIASDFSVEADEIVDDDEAVNAGFPDYKLSDMGVYIREEKTQSDDWSEPSFRESTTDKVYSPNHYGEKNGYDSYKQPIYKSPAPEKKPAPFRSAVSLILVCAIVCSLFSGIAAWLVTDYKLKNSDAGKQVVIGSSISSTVTPTTSGETDDQHTGDKLSGSQIYQLALAQVVGVNSEKTTNIFGQPTSLPVSGSGFVISEDGYILTNYHVIEYAVLYDFDLTVMFSDGKEYEAKIIGYEEQNDVAVIKIDATGLSPVTFADSDNMNVGDWVYPVGNPLGELSYSMTYGIISALDRVISTDNSTRINMFQIDAAVNKGNSGGPVYNEYGEVLGIVTAKYSDEGVEGLGFAIPINDVLDIVTQLIETGYIGGKAKLGITVQTVDNTFASYYNVPQGAYIMEIEKGSCAEKAGLKVGDIITALNGETFTDKEGLIKALQNYKAGDTVNITVYRSGEEIVITATLDEKLPVG